MLNELGYKAISLTGWQAGIYTNDTNQNALIEHIDTSRILKELQDRNIVIVAGFQGFNRKLDITTLGRGGSDTTALAIASALKAKHCYIFSDVDGVYTTDPNKFSEARKLQNLSYVEMLNIANEGAKVLHPRCVEIGEKFNIPIITKSTFNNEPGSIITNKIEDKTIKSIVKNDDIAFVTLKNDSYNAESSLQIYNLLISNNIMPIQFENNSSRSLNINFQIKNTDINKLQKLLESDLSTFSSSIKNISHIAIIGYSINADTSILQKVTDILKENSVDIYRIDITNIKIVLTFFETVENDLLHQLHEKLIGK